MQESILTPYESLSEGLIDCKKQMELNPSDSDPYFMRGAFFLTCKMYNDALDDFNKAIEMNPMRPHYYAARYEAHKHLQNYHIMSDDLEKWKEMCEQKGIALAENEAKICGEGDEK